MNDRTLLDRRRLPSGTRENLLVAARTLFSQGGYDGTSVRAIVRLAGTNLGAVTYHFGTKRDLYDAVLEEGLAPLVARVSAAADAEGTALERMLKVVDAYFGHFEEHPDLPHLLLQEVAAGKGPPEIVRETVGRLKETVGGLSVRGHADGSIRPGHPLLTALSVVAQPIYLTLVAPLLRSIGDIDLSDPDTRRMALQHCLAFVQAALAPQAAGTP